MHACGAKNQDYVSAYKDTINTLRQKQNGRYFPDDICKRIYLNGHVWITIKFTLKLVPQGPINNIPVFVLMMA